jgi:UDP-perosamine 4-acetyltransferase
VVLLGAGGHAAVVADALTAAGRRPVAALVHDRTSPSGELGVPLVEDREAIERFPPDRYELAMAVIGFGAGVRRHRLAQTWRGLGYRFATVVHPTAVIATGATLDEGAQVLAAAVLQPRCRIGRDAIVNTGAIVEHDCRLAEGSHLAPRVVLGGEVGVGERSQIGLGAVVIEGLRVGADSLVAAGAVVVRDVPGGVLVAGVPAREIGPFAG